MYIYICIFIESSDQMDFLGFLGLLSGTFLLLDRQVVMPIGGRWGPRGPRSESGHGAASHAGQ